MFESDWYELQSSGGRDALEQDPLGCESTSSTFFTPDSSAVTENPPLLTPPQSTASVNDDDVEPGRGQEGIIRAMLATLTKELTLIETPCRNHLATLEQQGTTYIGSSSSLQW